MASSVEHPFIKPPRDTPRDVLRPRLHEPALPPAGPSLMNRVHSAPVNVDTGLCSIFMGSVIAQGWSPFYEQPLEWPP